MPKVACNDNLCREVDMRPPLFSLREVVLFAVTIQVLLMSQPTWATSCSDLLSRKPNLRVLTVNFTPTPLNPNISSKATGPKPTGIFQFINAPSSKLAQDIRSKRSKIVDDVTLAISLYKKFVAKHSEPKELKSFSQNDVWILHGKYILLSEFVKHLTNSKNGYDIEAFERVKTDYLELEKYIDDLGFFNQLDKIGHTLVPTPRESIQRPFPREFHDAQKTLEAEINFISHNLLKTLSKADSNVNHGIPQRIDNSERREFLLNKLKNYFGLLNKHLGNVNNKIEIMNIDTLPVTKLIEETNGILSSHVLKKDIKFAQRSFSKTMRELARKLDGEIIQFEAMKILFKNSNNSSPQGSQASRNVYPWPGGSR